MSFFQNFNELHSRWLGNRNEMTLIPILTRTWQPTKNYSDICKVFVKGRQIKSYKIILLFIGV